jgi:signal transduction histidine kinase
MTLWRYAKSIFRNTVIIATIVSLTIFIIFPIVSRNADYFRYETLDYIEELGAEAALSSPVYDRYSYYSIVMDKGSNVLYASDTELSAQSHLYEQEMINYFRNNSTENYHTRMRNSVFYWSKRSFDIETNTYTVRILIDPEAGKNLQTSINDISVAQRLTMVPIVLICAIMTFFETRSFRKAWKSQKDFISSVAHEIRTPLTAISFSLNMLGDESYSNAIDSERLKEIVSTEIAHLSDLVNSLLMAARIESRHKISLCKEEIDLDVLLETAFKILWPLASAKSAQLMPHTKRGLTVYADERALRIAILSILKNALQYSPKDGKITAEVDEDANHVFIQISDEGKGIPNREKRKIFRRYYSFGGSSDAGNLGLGLYIAKVYLREHGGKIIVADNKPRGSKFVLVIPKI